MVSEEFADTHTQTYRRAYNINNIDDQNVNMMIMGNRFYAISNIMK